MHRPGGMPFSVFVLGVLSVMTRPYPVRCGKWRSRDSSPSAAAHDYSGSAREAATKMPRRHPLLVLAAARLAHDVRS